MPRTHVLNTDTLQAYIDAIPEKQRDNPVVKMLQGILDETYANGYPERIKLVNHASVVSATLWTEEHIRKALVSNGMSVLPENVETINKRAVPKLDETCRNAGNAMLATEVRKWQKEKYPWPR